MNKDDREYLDFLLSIKSDDDWDNWMVRQPPEELDRALMLIKLARSEDSINMMEINEALQSEAGLDCTEAMKVINRVKQGVSK